MQRDSIANTIFIALAVCLVCSFLVSAAAVGLRDRQNRNVSLDKMKNILLASGVAEDEIRNRGVEELFAEKVDTVVVDLETGESGESVEQDFLQATGFSDLEQAEGLYDPIAASDQKPLSTELDRDPASLKRRENYSFVYLVHGPSGDVEKYVFPIRGRGLWSTLKGFIAVETDFDTVAGLTYYEHGETPGLGGEVDNPNWKALWPGKEIYGDEGEVQVKVVKGTGEGPYAVDGLSGATITSNGVTNMLDFWFGENGFKPFIEKQKAQR